MRQRQQRHSSWTVSPMANSPTGLGRVVWPDLAKFRHFGEILHYLPKYFKLLLGILQNLDPTFSNLLSIGQIFIVVNGQNWVDHPPCHLVTLG